MSLFPNKIIDISKQMDDDVSVVKRCFVSTISSKLTSSIKEKGHKRRGGNGKVNAPRSPEGGAERINDQTKRIQRSTLRRVQRTPILTRIEDVFCT